MLQHHSRQFQHVLPEVHHSHCLHLHTCQQLDPDPGASLQLTPVCVTKELFYLYSIGSQMEHCIHSVGPTRQGNLEKCERYIPHQRNQQLLKLLTIQFWDKERN